MAQGGNGTVTPGYEHCNKKLYTVNQFIEHLAVDVLPRILDVALTTPTKFVYCQNCKAAVKYEKSVLESDRGTGLEIVCARCHSVVCTFLETRTAESAVDETKTGIACPKCGIPLPCAANFDSIDALRCPECDALFERGQFVCYGAKSAVE